VADGVIPPAAGKLLRRAMLRGDNAVGGDESAGAKRGERTVWLFLHDGSDGVVGRIVSLLTVDDFGRIGGGQVSAG